MRNTLTTLALLMAGTANAAPLSVATDIPPVHSLVSMVMGDRGEAVLLMDQGADAHDFQLRPSQARSVANADSVIWMGPELTLWLDDALESLRGDGATTAVRGAVEVAEDGGGLGERFEDGLGLVFMRGLVEQLAPAGRALDREVVA